MGEEKGLTSKEVIARAGIPGGSLRRELKLAGVGRVKGDRGRRYGNVIGYRYPEDAPARIIEARTGRRIMFDTKESARKLQYRAKNRGIEYDELINVIQKQRFRGASREQAECAVEELISLIKPGEGPK